MLLDESRLRDWKKKMSTKASTRATASNAKIVNTSALQTGTAARAFLGIDVRAPRPIMKKLMQRFSPTMATAIHPSDSVDRRIARKRQYRARKKP